MSHTPGPWKFDIETALVQTIDGRVMVDVDGIDCWRSNGHLIAAAPDLLDTLYRVLPFLEDSLTDAAYKPGVVLARIKEIRAAIAKAEGK